MKAKYGDGRSRGMSINLLEPEHFVSLLVVSAKSRQVLGRRVSRSPINCLKSRRLSQFTVSHCCTFTATWFVLSSLLWLQRGEMRANEMADPEAVSIFQQKRDAYTSEGLVRNASISGSLEFPKTERTCWLVERLDLLPMAVLLTLHADCSTFHAEPCSLVVLTTRWRPTLATLFSTCVSKLTVPRSSLDGFLIRISALLMATTTLVDLSCAMK